MSWGDRERAFEDALYSLTPSLPKPQHFRITIPFLFPDKYSLDVFMERCLEGLFKSEGYKYRPCCFCPKHESKDCGHLEECKIVPPETIDILHGIMQEENYKVGSVWL